MKPLSQVMTLHARQLKDEAPLIWLYEFEDASDPKKRYRLTNSTAAVDYGEDDEGVPITYSPAAIVHGGVTSTLRGDIPTITINLGNSILLSAVIDAGQGFAGRAARIILVSKYDLSNPGSGIVEHAEIIRVKCSTEVVSIEMGAGNLYKAKVPPRLFSRRKCGYIIGDVDCGYNLEAPGAAYTECPGYDYAACELVGDDEDLIGVTRKHPLNFGAFPGIPKGRSR